MAKAAFERLRFRPEARKRLKICWFLGKRVNVPSEKEWTHVKSMTVDDQFAIIGTGNQDPQSWYHSREQNYIIDDVATTMKIKRMLLKSQQSLTRCFNSANF